MSVFGDYARYYDLMYQDKAYLREVAFLVSILERFTPDVRDILDIGCGTGMHDFELARRAYAVTGIDVAEAMLARAEAKRVDSKPGIARRLEFRQADATSFSLGRSFGAVVSLFHVFGYLRTDEDLANAIAKVAAHLDDEGLFVFDFWHAPAVEASGPGAPERTVEDDDIQVKRKATPTWRPELGMVEVKYDFTVTDRHAATSRQFSEVHKVRYYSVEALTPLLAASGLVVIETGEWPTGAALSPAVFGAYIVARKQRVMHGT